LASFQPMGADDVLFTAQASVCWQAEGWKDTETVICLVLLSRDLAALPTRLYYSLLFIHGIIPGSPVSLCDATVMNSATT
jgi:uncharacterized membrane protein